MKKQFARWLAVGLVGGVMAVSAQAQGPEGGPGGPPGGPGGFGGPGGPGGGPGGFGGPGGPGGGFPGFGGPGGPGGPGGGPNLLSIESVQEDIKLTDKQKTQLKTIEATYRKKRQEMPRPGDESFDPQTMFETMNSMRRQQEAATTKVLDKTQKTRIAEIELQREGALAIANRKEVSTKLKLTTAQTKQVRKIAAELQQTLASAMPRPGGGGPGGFGGPGGGGPGGFGGPGGGGPGGDAGFNGPGGGGNNQAAQAGGNGQGGPGGGRRQRGNNANQNAAGGNGGQGGPGGGPGGGGPGGPGGGGPGGGPPDFNNPEMRAQFAKIRETVEKARKKASEQIEELLTKDQRIAFEKLQGKPFDLATLQPGGPGGPPEGDAPANNAQNKRQRRQPANDDN